MFAGAVAAAGGLFTGGNFVASKLQRTIRIQNCKDHDVIVECQEKNRNEGYVTIKPGESYSFVFYCTFASHWWCTVWPRANSNHSVVFRLHKGHEAAHVFELKNDGIYSMESNGGDRKFLNDWEE